MAIVRVGRVADRSLASEVAFTPACPMTFREFLHQCGKGLGVLSPYGDYESGICTLVVGETVTCAKARISSTVWGGYRLLDRRCAGRRRTPELHVVDVGLHTAARRRDIVDPVAKGIEQVPRIRLGSRGLPN